MTHLLAATAVVTLMLAALHKLKQVRYWHHGYLGYLLTWCPWWPVAVFGWLALIDDTWQHWRQIFDPAYRSPAHRLYARYLWPMRWVQKLSGWLDQAMTLRWAMRLACTVRGHRQAVETYPPRCVRCGTPWHPPHP